MRAALPALLVFLTISPVVAQQPIVPPPLQPVPAPSSRGKSTQHQIAVRGCLQNGRLRIADSVVKDLPFEMLNVSEFILDGPKEMLRQIKELHDGHYDEIAGVAPDASVTMPETLAPVDCPAAGIAKQMKATKAALFMVGRPHADRT
jgi:hypothetical protein